jgi:hypothetical protein
MSNSLHCLPSSHLSGKESSQEVRIVCIASTRGFNNGIWLIVCRNIAGLHQAWAGVCSFSSLNHGHAHKHMLSTYVGLTWEYIYY